MTIPHQDWTKTINSLIHQYCYQGTKSQSTELGRAKTQPRSLHFAIKHFTPHFLCICDNSPPRLDKNHNFTYSPIMLPKQKNPIHRTWLSQNTTKINSFCNPTFHTSFFMHLWQFPSKIAQIQHFTYSPILLPRQKKANPPNLAKPKPNLDKFLLQQNFSHLIFYAFVRIPHQDCTKTITLLIHKFCYQGKTSQSTEVG